MKIYLFAIYYENEQEKNILINVHSFKKWSSSTHTTINSTKSCLSHLMKKKFGTILTIANLIRYASKIETHERAFLP